MIPITHGDPTRTCVTFHQAPSNSFFSNPVNSQTDTQINKDRRKHDLLVRGNKLTDEIFYVI